MSLAELEAAVQRQPDPETLAVYADALEAAGDPRGELIAIDLAIATLCRTVGRSTSRTELVRRKRALIERWVGARIGFQTWKPASFEFGVFCGLAVHFDSARTVEATLRAALDSPVGSYVDRVRIEGRRADLAGALGLLAERGAPWLRCLSLGRHRIGGSKPLEARQWAAFAEAAPNLLELSLHGEKHIVTPVHPRLHTLRLGPGLALGGALPSIATVELQLTHSTLTPAHIAEVGIVHPHTFPALTTLDLATNEHLTYVTDGRPAILAAVIDAIPDLDRLRRLRLPSVRDAASARYVIDLAERFPALEVEIARMYDSLAGFAHPRIQVPPPRPWPSSLPHLLDRLSIYFSRPPVRDIGLRHVIERLEPRFDRVPAHARDAWSAVWEILDRVPRGARIPFATTTLVTAFDVLDDEDELIDALAAIEQVELAREPTLAST